MSDLQPIADRVEIEVLRGEFADATMGGDYDRWRRFHTGQCLVDPRRQRRVRRQRGETRRAPAARKGLSGLPGANSRTAGHADRSCCHPFLTDGGTSISHDPDYEWCSKCGVPMPPTTSDHQVCANLPMPCAHLDNAASLPRTNEHIERNRHELLRPRNSRRSPGGGRDLHELRCWHVRRSQQGR
jgi:hypothetical protein